MMLFAFGFIVGWALAKLFYSWPLLWRKCCLEHYATHKDNQLGSYE